MTIHADYTQNCYSVYPNFKHPRIKKVLAITDHIRQTVKEKFDVDSELCYNPLVLEPKRKPIILVSATRLSRIKRRRKNETTRRRTGDTTASTTSGTFSHGDTDTINIPNVIFLKERLDVWRWIQRADYLVQLSDTERTLI